MLWDTYAYFLIDRRKSPDPQLKPGKQNKKPFFWDPQKLFYNEPENSTRIIKASKFTTIKPCTPTVIESTF